MDLVIDLSDTSKALDLSNIRFQLMYDAMSYIVGSQLKEAVVD